MLLKMADALPFSYYVPSVQDKAVVTSQLVLFLQLVQPDSPIQDRLRRLNMCFVLQLLFPGSPRQDRLRRFHMYFLLQLVLPNRPIQDRL
jgi:hypothetical protein